MNKNELEAYELVPFRQAMKAGADAIVVAHITLARSDNTFYVVVEDLSANVNPVSDCLEMGGRRAAYGTVKVAVTGLKVSTTNLITNTNTQNSYIWARPDYVILCHTLRV
ncbi:hypothetical protein BOTNAR_0492g00100 [Botryotinia narcissicola]|uniref:Uncharacterized protein n=1 Tax=Botryotinia narcissicola TaxID=278944 RepID=A0A4Z1HGA7_9HELO|nr:hypothetical protein BOTNAR_0492g00100 [Botryotinia narcissicola]